MASTNKTTNYELSQYVGTDKPTYLSDYNGDMYKIDAQMKTNADNIATAISSASTATSTANSALSTAQSAESTANSASSTASSASTTAGNAQSTANSALSTATSAQSTANQAATDINTLNTKLNLTNFTSYDTSDKISITNGTFSSSNLQVATNSDGSIGKIYGVIAMTHASAAQVSCTIQTDLRPTSNITITCLGISQHWLNNNPMMGNAVDVAITTTGQVTFTCNFAAGTITKYFLFPCLLFMKDFGDTPSPNA